MKSVLEPDSHLDPERPLAEVFLVERCKANDNAAWNEFVERFKPMMYRRAYAILGNREDAEDVTSLAIARIYRSIARFRAECDLRPWVLRIVQNASLTFLRQKRTRPPEISLQVLDANEYQHELEIPDMSAGPEDLALADDLQTRYTAAVRRLPEFQRVLLQMTYSGRPYHEIANQTGLPLGTIKSRLARARSAIRRRLSDPISYSPR